MRKYILIAEMKRSKSQVSNYTHAHSTCTHVKPVCQQCINYSRVAVQSASIISLSSLGKFPLSISEIWMLATPEEWGHLTQGWEVISVSQISHIQQGIKPNTWWDVKTSVCRDLSCMIHNDKHSWPPMFLASDHICLWHLSWPFQSPLSDICSDQPHVCSKR